MSVREHEDNLLLIDDEHDQNRRQQINEPVINDLPVPPIQPDNEDENLDFLNLIDLEGEADVDVIMGRYFKTMRGLNATLESVYILMELGEEVFTMERKLLWGSESHINVLRKFDDMSSIHDARLAFVRRKAALLSSLKGEPTAQQSDAIMTRAKASIPKRLDYLVVRTTEEVMAMYQSIAKTDAARVLVCTNGSGIINFPATINLPSLTELKIKHTSGHLSGKLPET
uniref:DUF1308 domain-containing protein n=1 Tax=Strongyloides papillosus TaxID=174720 RepID=A0A0N5C5G1_STREA